MDLCRDCGRDEILGHCEDCGTCLEHGWCPEGCYEKAAEAAEDDTD